jgi:hypothetical protein
MAFLWLDIIEVKIPLSSVGPLSLLLSKLRSYELHVEILYVWERMWVYVWGFG